MTRILTLIAVAGAACTAFAPGALAKLPTPTEAQQAKAAETRARAAWSDKVAAYQLCRAQDKIAAHYLADRKAHGQPAREPVQTAACADPGPFVAPVPAPVPAIASTAGAPAAGAVQSPAKAP
ncbi:conserved hypothetical protein; putative exported protein [Cupriavidus taiwanensis]|uniref:Lipoprotein n=1 Tax=Cupriavidus taiwanensis TaxID=164546 RepID=A0A375E091_9BURK|nr:hypothetical protein [Cupriavidus taiwanensis]SOZ55478.1 conserved hypothetical protein; putative exported protein [Cupriavidus taiwanensis]SOZ56954.1 conserved hypothetical protein; putative exported protein [Cupriavidus taiwanensis]SOZ59120.1 conserved hypothetical protein; putative exported protein [Cupriavidus taiwanensis]SOZ98527.1 conserved hypothetical protein; putative exported protein [Cupriavidus taiwanensis]SPA05539.1 conserved hypothetical protein; putative exported protein [Cup